jgi:hypothetical protein
MKGAFMGSETFKKRQKEMARREKQKKKFARRLERKNEKARPGNKAERENPKIGQLDFRQGPTIL